MDESTMNDRQLENRDQAQSPDEVWLNDMFHAYRDACPDPEPSVNFMPAMWAKIEAREESSTIFSRVAKGLVTAALGASVLMGLLSASSSQPVATSEGSYIQALAADHASTLEPLQVERISELEQ
jgi:hypothetical protein